MIIDNLNLSYLYLSRFIHFQVLSYLTPTQQVLRTKYHQWTKCLMKFVVLVNVVILFLFLKQKYLSKKKEKQIKQAQCRHPTIKLTLDIISLRYEGGIHRIGGCGPSQGRKRVSVAVSCTLKTTQVFCRCFHVYLDGINRSILDSLSMFCNDFLFIVILFSLNCVFNNYNILSLLGYFKKHFIYFV